MKDDLDYLNEYLAKATESVKEIYTKLGYKLEDLTIPSGFEDIKEGKVELNEDDINKLLNILDNIDERLSKKSKT